VIEVLHAQDIENAHFVGVSLGSIVIKQIELLAPSLVKSMIFAGAITRLNFKSRLLLKMGRALNRIIPQMGLYQLFARIMMPKKNHASSRELFTTEARKIVRKEFNRWFKLTSRLALYLIELEKQTDKTPTLFIMGEEDHLFLAPVKKLVALNPDLNLSIVPNCGHVVNFEQAETFNHLSLQFIDRVSA
jgi:pimeloyl-ACP methyl ester carboxylesterase